MVRENSSDQRQSEHNVEEWPGERAGRAQLKVQATPAILVKIVSGRPLLEVASWRDSVVQAPDTSDIRAGQSESQRRKFKGSPHGTEVRPTGVSRGSGDAGGWHNGAGRGRGSVTNEVCAISGGLGCRVDARVAQDDGARFATAMATSKADCERVRRVAVPWTGMLRW
jgi:hypothetical protein